MSHLTDNTRLAREQRFAYKVRQALNESADALLAARLEQLAAARKAALQAHKPTRQTEHEWAISPALLHLGGGQAVLGGPSFLSPGKLALAVAALLLVATSVISLFHVEQQRRVEELADVDAGVLIDDLPISAYADHGFNAFLKQNH
jgi:hypothetical protein